LRNNFFLKKSWPEIPLLISASCGRHTEAGILRKINKIRISPDIDKKKGLTEN
jgi:hypothetical protein